MAQNSYHRFIVTVKIVYNSQLQYEGWIGILAERPWTRGCRQVGSALDY